jgi:hypothetical protein
LYKVHPKPYDFRLMRILLAALSFLVLTACAAPLPPSDRVAVARDISLALPAPADLGRAIEATQLVTARRAGETHVFEARLSVDRERLMLVGTDMLGRRAMTIEWRAGSVTVDKAAWVPDSLRPENVLADIVMIYWPDAVLASAVHGAAVASDSGGRRIGDAIRVNWDGDPWTGAAKLVNSSFDYELSVRSALVAP